MPSSKYACEEVLLFCMLCGLRSLGLHFVHTEKKKGRGFICLLFRLKWNFNFRNKIIDQGFICFLYIN